MTIPMCSLSVDTTFEVDRRRGKVIEVRQSSCLVLWDEFVDPQTGEVYPAISSAVDFVAVNDWDAQGLLRVISRVSASGKDGDVDFSLRTDKERQRMNWRLCYVTAAQAAIDKSEVAPTRASFIANQGKIITRGGELYHNFLLEQAGGGNKRGGAAIRLETQFTPANSGAQIHEWYLNYLREGRAGLFDNYRRSGNRSDRYDQAVISIVHAIIEARLDEERPSINSIVSSVQSAIRVRNADARKKHPPENPWPVPGYDYIRSQIEALAPLAHAVRSRGMKVAYRDMHARGIGVVTERVLERVEIDEYLVDLVVFLKKLNVWEWLTPQEREQLGLDKNTGRVTLSAAIDVHTRVLLALKISAGANTSLARETVEMMLTDKTPFADAVGAHDRWDMFGRPETIVFDRGPTYQTDEVYDILGELGITNLGAAAKKPWLRPFIERMFGTIHRCFVQRFSGRTFSNVVAKGENDPEARASLTIDELLTWLVRWIVDVYHNQPHEGLSGRTPAEAWAKAIAKTGPKVVSRDEMRKCFGIRETRKLGSHGLRVMNINYQTAELADFCNRQGRGKSFEVRWWPRDIGVILVKTSPKSWMSVSAADPKWIGRSFVDLLDLEHRLKGHREISDAVRAQAIVDIDNASYQAKVRFGLLPEIVNAENMGRIEKRLRRFMVTTDQKIPEDKMGDLFDGEVIAEESFQIPDQRQVEHRSDFDGRADDELME